MNSYFVVGINYKERFLKLTNRITGERLEWAMPGGISARSYHLGATIRIIRAA